MNKITELTAKQALDLIDFRQKWLEIGLSTTPIDFDKSKKIITNFYQRVGKKPPVFLRFSSPLITQLAMNLIKRKGINLRDQLGGQLGGQLGDHLEDQLEGQLWDQLWGQLWDQLWDQLGESA